jgi:hypothetical protein
MFNASSAANSRGSIVPCVSRRSQTKPLLESAQRWKVRHRRDPVIWSLQLAESLVANTVIGTAIRVLSGTMKFIRRVS